jgi:hypothetical protein
VEGTGLILRTFVINNQKIVFQNELKSHLHLTLMYFKIILTLRSVEKFTCDRLKISIIVETKIKPYLIS